MNGGFGVPRREGRRKESTATTRRQIDLLAAATVVVVRPDDGNAVVLELSCSDWAVDDVRPIYPR